MRMTPGPFGVGNAWPRRKTTARSYSRRILIEPRTYSTTMTMMMRVNMLMAGCFLAQEVYLSDTGASPSRAHAPVARFVGFAPLSLTLRVVGDRCGLQVLPLRFAQGRDDRLGCGP